MNRRTAIEFLACLALGAPFAARAQPARARFRVGTLSAAWAANHPAIEGLRAGLAALGMEEGRDFTFEHRFVEGRVDELPSAAAALIAGGVDALFTVAENATRAAAAATRKVPIVFANVGDPVLAGLVNTLSHPGGNLTGVSNIMLELAPKRLEMLKFLAPGLRRVFAIYDAEGGSTSRQQAQKAGAAAPALGIQYFDRRVSSHEELAAALAAVQPGDGVLHFASGGSSLDVGSNIIEAATRAKALTMFESAFWLEYGALASYGADHFAVGHQAARLLAKVLAGSHPRDLPVEGANRIELVISLRAAKVMGIEIPRAALLRAERVIE